MVEEEILRNRKWQSLPTYKDSKWIEKKFYSRKYWCVWSLETAIFCVLQGPFATFKMQYDRTCEWTGLKFSNDGKLILISTNGSFIRLIDAFKGVVMHTFGVSWQLWNMALSLLIRPGLGNAVSWIVEIMVIVDLVMAHGLMFSSCTWTLPPLYWSRSPFTKCPKFAF